MKTAPKKRKRKGDNTEILTEAVNLLKTAVENDASKEMLAFLKEDIEKSREHELKLFKLLCTQDGVQQPTSYPPAPSYNPYMSPVAPPFRTGVMPGYARMYGGEPTGRPLPQAPPQLRVIYCIISCLKMQAVLMSVPLIVIFKLEVLNAVHIR